MIRATVMADTDSIRLVRKHDIAPKCPRCDKRLETVFYREMYGGMFGKRYIYFCPYCENVLGVSHRKGFWMG